MRGNELIQNAPIRCYDTGGVADRYTVVYMREWRHQSSYGYGAESCTRCYGPKLYQYIGMSGAPFHPQGIGQHGEARIGRHLGKRIPFTTLPQDCKRAVLQDLSAEVALD